MSGAASEDVLRRAERRGLIILRPTSTIENEPEYLFRHVLIRDVAYNSVPRKRRALAHAETGRWIERLAGTRVDEVGELIAFHYAAAVTGEDADLGWAGDDAGRETTRGRAFEVLLRAGASARRRFAVDKALDLHGQALALAATADERARAHEELGDDHEALFHGDGAVSEYLAAIELLEAQGHRIGEVGARSEPGLEAQGRLVGKAGRMVLRWGTFQGDPPLERVQELVDRALAQPASDPVRATLLMVNGGLYPSASGMPMASRRTPLRSEAASRMADRIASIQDGLQIARALDDVELLYFGNDLLSIAYQTAGDYENMRHSAEAQGALLERMTSPRQQVDSLVSLAMVRTNAGDYGRALEAAEDGYRRSGALSPHERMHVAYEMLSAWEPLGRWDDMANLLPWFAKAAAEEGEITCASVRAGPPFAATILARRGDIDGALALVAIDPARESIGTFVTAAHYANYASVAAPPEVARKLVRSALTQVETGFLELGVGSLVEAMTRLDMLDEMESFLDAARTRAAAVATIQPVIDRAVGVIATSRGEPRTAERSLRTAMARFDALGVEFDRAQTQELLAGLVESPERDALLEAALESYLALGAVPYAARVRAALASSEGRLAR